MRYSPEVRERAVRLVRLSQPDYPSESAACRAVADRMGIGSTETVRRWVRRADPDDRDPLTGDPDSYPEVVRLRLAMTELQQTIELLASSAAQFASDHDLPPPGTARLR